MKTELIDATIEDLRRYGKDFSEEMETKVRKAMSEAWHDGWEEGHRERKRSIA